jgi:AcrR family transcriptional regulator
MILGLSAKERILDAAMNRMISVGYRKVSMDEIAQDLAISKNTIYKYFSGKTDLARGLFTRLKQQINQELLLIEEAHQNPVEVISKSVFFIQKQLGPWYQHFWGDVKIELPALYQDFVDFRSEKISSIRGIIDKGIKKGKFRKISSAVAVGCYLGAIDQVLHPEFLQQEKISFPQAIEAIMDIWYWGVLKGEKP